MAEQAAPAPASPYTYWLTPAPAPGPGDDGQSFVESTQPKVVEVSHLAVVGGTARCGRCVAEAGPS